jgi:hypothetical protein
MLRKNAHPLEVSRLCPAACRRKGRIPADTAMARWSSTQSMDGRSALRLAAVNCSEAGAVRFQSFFPAACRAAWPHQHHGSFLLMFYSSLFDSPSLSHCSRRGLRWMQNPLCVEHTVPLCTACDTKAWGVDGSSTASDDRGLRSRRENNTASQSPCSPKEVVISACPHPMKASASHFFVAQSCSDIFSSPCVIDCLSRADEGRGEQCQSLFLPCCLSSPLFHAAAFATSLSSQSAFGVQHQNDQTQDLYEQLPLNSSTCAVERERERTGSQCEQDLAVNHCSVR